MVLPCLRMLQAVVAWLKPERRDSQPWSGWHADQLVSRARDAIPALSSASTQRQGSPLAGASLAPRSLMRAMQAGSSLWPEVPLSPEIVSATGTRDQNGWRPAHSARVSAQGSEGDISEHSDAAQAATARTPVRTSPSGHLPMAYSVMHSKPSLKRGQSWCSMLSGA